MRALWIGGLAAAALSLAAGAASAQAWFGVPTPGSVSPPDQPTFHAGPASYGPAPFQGRPKDDARGALSGPKLMADVSRIVGFSLESKAAGDLLYGRISGLPAEKKTVDWTDPTHRGNMLSAHIHKTCSVTGWEDVAVPAGTFHALKIVCKGVTAGDAHTVFKLSSDVLSSPITAEESTHVY